MSRQTTIYEIDTGVCHLCGKEGDVLHHISYFPEIKMRVCRKCHAHIKKTHPKLCKYTNEDYHKFYGDRISNICTYQKILVSKEELVMMLRTKEIISLGEIFSPKTISELLDRGELDEMIKYQMEKDDIKEDEADDMLRKMVK